MRSPPTPRLSPEALRAAEGELTLYMHTLYHTQWNVDAHVHLIVCCVVLQRLKIVVVHEFNQIKKSPLFE